MQTTGRASEYATTRLPRDVRQQIERIAAAEDRTVSAVMRRLIESALNAQQQTGASS